MKSDGGDEMTEDEARRDKGDDLYATADFESFWAIYAKMHADPRTRIAHALGTMSAAGLIGLGLATGKVGPVLLAPLADHLLAQASHRLIEHNRTTPLRRPIWHLRAELRLFRETCREVVGRA